MQSYTCPSCGAPITFRSSFSVYAVCESCGSTVLRADRDVAVIGTMADLPDEISPLQVGTSFSFDGARYTLLGRTRMAWADGAWSEWYADSGARQGWLAEAQGFYGFSVERPVPETLAGSHLALDQVVTIDGEAFRIADIKQATCIGSEGELPFAAPRGRVATYFDMIGRSSGFAGIEQSDEGRRLYVGRYVGFDALGFANLRKVDGWSEPTGVPEMAGDPGASDP